MGFKKKKESDDDDEIDLRATKRNHTRQAAVAGKQNLKSQIELFGTYSKPKKPVLKFEGSTSEPMKIENTIAKLPENLCISHG